MAEEMISAHPKRPTCHAASLAPLEEGSDDVGDVAGEPRRKRHQEGPVTHGFAW